MSRVGTRFSSGRWPQGATYGPEALGIEWSSAFVIGDLELSIVLKASYISRVAGFRTRPLSLFILISCCAYAFIPVAFSQSATENNNSKTIQGIVVNNVTGEPISRALVFSRDNRLGAFTDASGRFEFTVSTKENPSNQEVFSFGAHTSFHTYLRGTSVDLVAKKPGFLEDADVSTHREASGRNITISLLPEAIIHGRVITSNNETAERLNVQLFKQEVREGAYHWTSTSTVRTNSQGEFRFAELRPGAYRIMTQELLDTDPQDLAPNSQLYGFPPVCFPGVPDFASGSTLHLTAGQDVQADIPLTRQAYFRVRIPVLNSAATQGLNVAVYAGDHPGPGYSLGYNSQTSRIEGLLPSGIYRVEADSFFPTPASGAVDIRVAGSAMEGPSLALLPNGVIPIDVHEEFTSQWQGSPSWSDGKHTYQLRGPRAYLQIWLESADDFVQGPTPALRNPTSASDASLLIDNARPGVYWVHVQSARGYAQAVTSGSRDLLREPLILSSGSHAPIEITMRDDTAVIEGSITGVPGQAAASEGNGGLQSGIVSSNPPGPPLAYIMWVPLRDNTAEVQQLGVSGDAKFQSPPLPPGAYRVLAFAHLRQNFAYRDPQVMKTYESMGQVVNLTPGQTEHVDVQLIPDE